MAEQWNEEKAERHRGRCNLSGCALCSASAAVLAQARQIAELEAALARAEAGSPADLLEAGYDVDAHWYREPGPGRSPVSVLAWNKAGKVESKPARGETLATALDEVRRLLRLPRKLPGGGQ